MSLLRCVLTFRCRCGTHLAVIFACDPQHDPTMQVDGPTPPCGTCGNRVGIRLQAEVRGVGEQWRVLARQPGETVQA